MLPHLHWFGHQWQSRQQFKWQIVWTSCPNVEKFMGSASEHWTGFCLLRIDCSRISSISPVKRVPTFVSVFCRCCGIVLYAAAHLCLHPVSAVLFTMGTLNQRFPRILCRKWILHIPHHNKFTSSCLAVLNLLVPLPCLLFCDHFYSSIFVLGITPPCSLV